MNERDLTALIAGILMAGTPLSYHSATDLAIRKQRTEEAVRLACGIVGLVNDELKVN